MAKIKQLHAYESAEQEALFTWAEYMTATYPELVWMYHIPNGGSRNKAEAASLKRQGVKSGVPDICLPVPKGRYHGLYIELKANDNTLSENQKLWIKGLSENGHLSTACWGWESARDIILKYLRLGGFKHEN